MHFSRSLIWFIGLLLFVLIGTTASAQEAESVIVPPTGGSGSSVPFGEVQKMSALLRGNGEAVVLLKHAFSNTDTPGSEQANLVLKPPAGVELGSLKAYQLILPPVCLEYSYDTGGPNCLKTGDPDYTADYFYSDQGQPSYHELSVTTNDERLLDIALQTPVAYQKFGAVILHFRTTDYIREHWGELRSYRVTSFGSTEELAEVTIGIDVDTDLFLKGKRSEITYRSEILGAASVAQDSAAGGFTSSRFDQAVQTIGQGAIVKSAKLLAPEESLTAKGSYATTWVRLHVPTFGMIVFVLALLGTITYLNIHRSHKKQAVAVFGYWGELWTGLLVAGLVTSYAYLVYWIQTTVTQYYFLPPFDALVAILSVLVYVALLAGPVVWVWIRRGWQAGFIMLGSELLWLMIIVTLVFIFSDQIQPIDKPIPYGTAYSSEAHSAPDYREG